MAISHVSPTTANLPAPTATKPTNAPKAKITPPHSVKPAVDKDGDRDGSGGINVKA